MRVRAICLVAVAAIGLAAVEAGAENQTVAATFGSTFNPATVRIDPGESVTWNNSGGSHNVKFEDGMLEEPPDPSPAPWTVTRTFPTAGRFAYYCEMHGARGGVGMSGTVVVGDPEPAGDTTAPAITKLKASPQRFCPTRSRTCKATATNVTFRLSEPAQVRVTLTRRGKVRKTVRAVGSQGQNSVKVRGRGLAAGAYRVEVIATDSAANRSRPARTSVTIGR